jgi:hypothetical protein
MRSVEERKDFKNKRSTGKILLDPIITKKSNHKNSNISEMGSG